MQNNYKNIKQSFYIGKIYQPFCFINQSCDSQLLLLIIFLYIPYTDTYFAPFFPGNKIYFFQIRRIFLSLFFFFK